MANTGRSIHMHLYFEKQSYDFEVVYFEVYKGS